MSDLELNAEDNVATTMELDEVEESIAVPHKSGRKWAWIGASVFGVALFAAVGASLGKRNDAGTPSARARERQVQVEMQRADYDLYAEDDDAEGRLREPVCWVHGPDNLPVKVVSYNASEIVFAEDQVRARNDIVCGGGRAAAPGRRRLKKWSWWRPRCTRINRDCVTGRAEAEGWAFSKYGWLDCTGTFGEDRAEGAIRAVLNFAERGWWVEYQSTVRCHHRGYYYAMVNDEPRYDYRFWDGVHGSLKVGLLGSTTTCNSGSGDGCHTHQTCVDYECV